MTVGYLSSIIYGDAIWLLGCAEADGGFALLQSIKLLTVFFPTISFSTRGATNARKFLRNLQSVIRAKGEAFRPIQQVVVMDKDGTMPDWEALFLENQREDPE
jgi:hypothetical protein